jgi:hypothetical protein
VLKRLSIFAVFLAVACACFAAQREAANPQSNSGGHKSDNGNDKQPPPPHPMAVPETTDRQTLADDPQRKEGKDGWDKAAVLSNYLLVIVGIGGIVVAACTLQKIERQIRAAEADTEAMARAERAWIVIHVESPAPNQFNFIATNTGRIPADVKSIWTTSIVTKRGENLEVPIDEKTRESLMNTPPCLIPPTASQIVFRCNIDEMEKRGIFGFAELRFYGRILYSDILQPADSVPHETKWLYWQFPLEGALPFPDPMRPEHNGYS